MQLWRKNGGWEIQGKMRWSVEGKEWSGGADKLKERTGDRNGVKSGNKVSSREEGRRGEETVGKKRRRRGGRGRGKSREEKEEQEEKREGGGRSGEAKRCSRRERKS